ncbi:MAG: mechanosensitive ion channel family protein [Ignavibacteriales bacterium]|nr:mechanosensitive ion channel family protein [Ignavibacteriales bacterium]
MNKLLTYFYELIGNDLLFQLCISAAVIFLGIIAAKLSSFISRKMAQPYVKKTKTKQDDKLVEIVGWGVFRLVIIAALFASLGIFENDWLFLIGVKSTVINAHPYLAIFTKILDVLLFLYFVFTLVIISFKLTVVLLDWYSESIDGGENRNLSGSLFPLIKKVAKVIIFLIAVVAVLSKFDVNISGLLVSLGVGSLAVALAAQETLSNMISGFAIMIDRPFRIGDRILYADNKTGDVIEIGIRSTKILDFDHNIVVIPNNEIIKSHITNLSYPSSETRVVVEIGVAYGTDIQRAKNLLLDIVKNDEDIIKETPPEVYLINFADSSLVLRLTCRTNNYKNVFEIQCRTREKIYEIFRRENIEIPFPQRVITINNSSSNFQLNKK